MTGGLDTTDPAELPAATPLVARITEKELAAHWRISTRSLQRWRIAGTGPAWMLIGARVIYRRDDVLAFEAAQLTDPGL